MPLGLKITKGINRLGQKVENTNNFNNNNMLPKNLHYQNKVESASARQLHQQYNLKMVLVIIQMVIQYN